MERIAFVLAGLLLAWSAAWSDLAGFALAALATGVHVIRSRGFPRQ